MGKVFDECQAFACAIQDCLQKNNYQQDACSSAIESMLDCCEQNEDKGFPSCDGFKFNLNKRKQARERAAAASDKKKY